VPLHVEVQGTGPPLVLLHGFTQTGRLWGPFGEALAPGRRLISIDLPGHAGSDGVRADLESTAALVAEAVISRVGSVPCDLLGYSLGARVALHVAIGNDLPLSRLVLIGATGGIDDAAAREQRRRADNDMADALEASGDVDQFVADWLRGPLFTRLRAIAADDSAERVRNTAGGLASSLRLCGTGTQMPLWDHISDITVPMLAMAGADDERFSAHAFRLASLAADGAVSLVPGGGHAVHLAQPALVGRLVTHWLTMSG